MIDILLTFGGNTKEGRFGSNHILKIIHEKAFLRYYANKKKC